MKLWVKISWQQLNDELLLVYSVSSWIASCLWWDVLNAEQCNSVTTLNQCVEIHPLWVDIWMVICFERTIDILTFIISPYLLKFTCILWISDCQRNTTQPSSQCTNSTQCQGKCAKQTSTQCAIQTSSQCATSTQCQSGCGPNCCSQTTAQVGQCPVACSSATGCCPPYCSYRCCKRRSQGRVQQF